MGPGLEDDALLRMLDILEDLRPGPSSRGGGGRVQTPTASTR